MEWIKVLVTKPEFQLKDLHGGENSTPTNSPLTCTQAHRKEGYGRRAGKEGERKGRRGERESTNVKKEERISKHTNVPKCCKDKHYVIFQNYDQ